MGPRTTRALAAVLALGIALPGCQEVVELDPGGATCAAVGEACQSERECCSRLCVDDGAGVSACQPLGGCLVAGERCTSDAACCGGACVAGRCTEATGCAAIGEVCRVPGDPSASRECCADAALRVACRPGGAGIDRCAVMETPPVCASASAPCRVPEDCCSRVCVADAAGVLACADACRAVGQSCSRSADCCDGTCSGGTCGGARSCGPLGAACTASGECCSALCASSTCQAPPA